jgi:hypothetical protein
MISHHLSSLSSDSHLNSMSSASVITKVEHARLEICSSMKVLMNKMGDEWIFEITPL